MPQSGSLAILVWNQHFERVEGLIRWRDSPQSISFQQVEQANPAAADVLRLCAFLAPDAIPEELLTRGAAELSAVLGEAAADLFKLNEALEVLRRYSLVRRNGSTHVLSIHRLVQTVLKESMNQETQRAWAERTVRAVNAAFPEIDYGTGANRQFNLQYYLPHVQEGATLIKQYHLHFPEAAQLLYQAGAFLYFHGFHLQSQSLHQQALAIREQVLGSEHPAVAESLNVLAILSRLQGDYEQAEGFHREALAIREKALGSEHPATAVSFSLILLFCLLFKQAMFVSPVPAVAGNVLAIEWAHLDLITKVSVRGKQRQMNTI